MSVDPPEETFSGLMSSHNNNKSGLINYGRSQTSPVNNANTGRSINHASFFASLQFYNNDTSWDAELMARYGHDAHVRIQQDGGRHYPRFYIPPQQWWCDLATQILRLASNHEKWYATRGLPPEDVYQMRYNIIVEVCQQQLRGDSAYSFGYFVPNCLPSSHSPEHAEAILLSTLAIALIWDVMDYLVEETNPSMTLLHHTLSVTSQLYNKIKPFFSNSRSINSNNFANTAIESCRKAIKYFERILSHYKRELADELERNRRAEEEELASLRRQADEKRIAKARAKQLQKHKREFEFRKVRARLASEQLHRNYQIRNDAAIIIQNRYRGRLVRSYIAACNARRAKLSSLCRGASRLARIRKRFDALIADLTRPPTSMDTIPDIDTPPPPSNNRESTHPFRDRGLTLPKRKRRQNNRRRHRRRLRPPKKYRGSGYVKPSPPIVPPPPDTPQDDATSTSSSTASPKYHVKSAKSVTCMPLCIWAAQTRAAEIVMLCEDSSTDVDSDMDSTEIVTLCDSSTTEVDPNMDSTPPPIASKYENVVKQLDRAYDDFLAVVRKEGLRKIAMDGKKSSNLFRYSSDMG